MTDTLAPKLSALRNLVEEALHGAEEGAEAVISLPEVRQAISAAESLGAASAAAAISGMLPAPVRPLAAPVLAWLFGKIESEIDSHLTALALSDSMEAEGKAAGAGDPAAPLVKMSQQDGANAVQAAVERK